MSTDITPSGGSIVLRGIQVPLESDVGREYVLACARNWEKLLTDADLCERFGLTLEQWQASGANKPLVKAVQLEHERRVRRGIAQQELAAREFMAAPAVLGGIMRNESNNPRHRIEAANSLRQTAIGPDSESKAQTEKFTISINFGTAKINKTIELKPSTKHEEEDGVLRGYLTRRNREPNDE
jgi:hypothetical protein